MNRIMNEREFINQIINRLYEENLVSFVEKIEVGDNCPTARYYIDKKKLSFNYNSIISYILNEANKIKFNSDLERIKYINLRILSILLHEIIHVQQTKKKNELILLSEEVEFNLKKQNKYSELLYLMNPVERQAQIIALEQTIVQANEQAIDKSTKFLRKQLIDYIKFGYAETIYPIMIYFRNTNVFEKAIDYSKRVTNEFNEKIEYGCELSNAEFERIKELKI